MASPNSTYTDVVTTTLEGRSKQIADNVTENNAILKFLKKRGNVRTFSGGRTIVEELSFAENANAQWYSGYDTLAVGATSGLTAAEYSLKQLAVGVSQSGLESLQNAGEAAVIDLMESKIKVAEATMANMIATGLYSDGTASSSKTITGLDAAVPADPTTGTYGGINRATAGNEFWRSQLNDVQTTSSTIQGEMNELWAACSRGTDVPDLILADNLAWAQFMSSLQTIQRFSSADVGQLGFQSAKYMTADFVLDGGIGGNATASTIYMLNTKYLFLRPHANRNMTTIGKKRESFNQDAEVVLLGWAGNLTCSGARFQGRGVFS
jgi:hypothetical protein